MKDLKLDHLSPAEYAELRQLVGYAKKATAKRYKSESACAEAHAHLARRRAELANSEKEEAAALAQLNRFLAAHRKKPQPHPQPQANNQVANSWSRRCEAEAAQDKERARRERFTMLG